MIKFLIKKNFFDIWDNLVHTFVLNIVFMAVIAAYVFCVRNIMDSQIIVFLCVSCVTLFIICLILMAFAAISYRWVRYDNFEKFSALKGFLKNKIGHLVLFYVLVAFIIACFLIFIPYYLSLKSYIGIILAVILFWANLFLALSLQYFLPLVYAVEKKPLSVLRDSLKLFLDNKAYSLFTALNSVFVFFVSALTFFMIPGFMGLSVMQGVSVKLLLIRNSYLRRKPIQRRDIDYRDMLEEESANLGKRTIRGMFAPWKKDR